jgi:hypothetical protein
MKTAGKLAPSRRRKTSINFLDGEARQKARREAGYLVRLFDSKGRYPKARLAHRDALYWADDDLVFMVTWCEPWDKFGDLPYTEMDWATAQELKLLASILLCELADGPPMRFYPVHGFAMWIDATSLNLASPSVARSIKQSLTLRTLRPDMAAGEGAILRCLDGGYDLRQKKQFDLLRHQEIWSLISTDVY